MGHGLLGLVADGLDLTSTSAATPIGMGCRVCERLDCPQPAARSPQPAARSPQRAAPPLGRPPRIEQNSSTFVPYPVAGADGRS